MSIVLCDKNEPHTPIDLEALDQEEVSAVLMGLYKKAQLYLPIADLFTISYRVSLTLKKNKLLTLADVLAFPVEKWRTVRNFGRKSYHELRDCAKVLGESMPEWDALPFAMLLVVFSIVGCELSVKEKDVPPVQESIVRFIQPCTTQKTEAHEGKWRSVPGEAGFQHIEEKKPVLERRAISHCIPCEKASSHDEQFVCAGEGPKK